MDAVFSEKINRGALCLYQATSKMDFFSDLDCFLGGVFDGVSFSVVSPAHEAGEFYLEHSSVIGTPEISRPVVLSHELSALDSGQDRHFDDEEAPLLAWGPHRLPIRMVKPIAVASDLLGLLVFHERLVATDEEQVSLIESSVFSHVSTAYHRLCELERLSNRLEQADSSVEAVRLMGDVLGHLDLETLLSQLIAVCIRLTGAQVGRVTLKQGMAEDVEWALSKEVLEQLRFRDGPSIVSEVMKTGEPILVRGYSEDDQWEPVDGLQIDSVLSVPFVAKSGVLGAVNLVNADEGQGGIFQERDKVSIVTICSLATAAIENAILHRDLLEKEKLEAKLQVARTIQSSMYAVDKKTIPGYESAWTTRTCDETGGDYLDLISLPEPRMAFAVGDVSGHGIGAALLMATGRANLRALLSVKNDRPRDVLNSLNVLLGHDLLDMEMFMTMFVSFLDYERHELAYVNAGHDQPLFYRAEDQAVTQLRSSGIPLGLFHDWEYEAAEVLDFTPGSVLLITTDGAWEVANRDFVPFEKKRLEELLEEHHDRSAEEIVALILEAIDEHLDGHLPQDDLTLMVVKRVDG